MALKPQMDGFDLCSAWMQEEQLKVIPSVFYSATYTSPDDERLAPTLGAVRYLIKPLAEIERGRSTTYAPRWPMPA